jgi:hypothetical protein
MRFLPTLARGGTRRRIAVIVGAVAVAALAVASTGALAANPTVNHFNDSGTFPATDFCGTGETMNGTFAVKGTEWLTPNQPGVDYRNTAEGNNTFTNPENGNTIVVKFAGPFTVMVLSVNPDGGDTELDTFKGLPEQMKTAQGTFLFRDAGYITFLRTFDGDGNVVSSQIVIDRGPHPDAESDGAVFCDLATSALGL